MKELSESEKQKAEDVSKEDMYKAIAIKKIMISKQEELISEQEFIIRQLDAIIKNQTKEIRELKNEISNLVLPFKGCAFVEEPDPDPEDGVWN